MRARATATPRSGPRVNGPLALGARDEGRAWPAAESLWNTWSPISNPRRRGLSEEARRANDQDADDQGESNRELQLGADHVRADEVLEHTHHESPQRGAARTVDSAQQRR